MDLTGKGVFLTGGARGLGRGMTEALLAKGAKVLICDINTETGLATEGELQKQYGAENVIFKQCDVTDSAQLKAAFEAAVSKFGAVDICVNNAGIMDERVWEKMIAINLAAQIRGCQLALEHMRRDRGGRGGLIINTVSTAGLYPGYWFPVYTATKHAMIGFTTSWAKNPKMPEMGVRWRCLCPDGINTDLLVLQENQVHDVEDFMKEVRAAGILEPEEVVEAFMKIVQDQDSDDVIFELWKGTKGQYRRRQLVDSDGVSNLVTVDTPTSSSSSAAGGGDSK
ncbi:hypothetical protein BaRGS_00037549 [Batillaria attramentaria]|uniref:15-hydroxyprostaglandin dehydrogenase [NAD(+)] n=1 Tax=Batillaria attramentaria TaxID=370345 RepID=A0ABD0J8S2_9CAEN